MTHKSAFLVIDVQQFQQNRDTNHPEVAYHTGRCRGRTAGVGQDKLLK